MKISIVLLFIIMLALSSCATTKEACCPPENVMVFVLTPWGLLHIEIDEGLFDEEDDYYWMYSEKYDKLMEEDKIKDELKKQSEDAAKETDKVLGI